MGFNKEGKKWDRDKLLNMAYMASLFENELVKEFFDQTEYQLWKKWTSNPDYEEREKLYLQSQGLAAFRSFLNETIQDGKMAAHEIELENEKLKIRNKNKRQ